MKKRLVSILALSLTLIMCVLVFAGCTKKLDYEEYIADTQEAHDEYLKNHNERRGTAIIDGESYEFSTSYYDGRWHSVFEIEDETTANALNQYIAPIVSVHANTVEQIDGATYARLAEFKKGEAFTGWQVEDDGTIYKFDKFTFLTEVVEDGETKITIYW